MINQAEKASIWQLIIPNAIEILAIASRGHTIQAANSKGADQTARMWRLICAFVVRTWYKQVFCDVTHISLCWSKQKHWTTTCIKQPAISVPTSYIEQNCLYKTSQISFSVRKMVLLCMFDCIHLVNLTSLGQQNQLPNFFQQCHIQFTNKYMLPSHF